MPKVRQTNEWTESDALAEVIAADPCDFMLETSPPDYVQKISQFLESSSVGPTGRDAAAADRADTDSDSADSLFITQKPVPEAVRSGRRQRCSVRSGPTSSGLQEESEDDSSPSASQEPRSKKNKKKIKIRVPKYSFPFLKDRTLELTSTVLPGPQNIRLHYSAMGGFFECMRKLRQSYQTGEDLESNLPTVDMNGECIFPISEEEDGTSEDADIKVVAKKHFVVPSKVKHSQPWYSEKKRDGEAKQQKTSCINAVGKMSRGGWRKTLHKIPTKKPSLRTALPSDLASSDDEESSYRILGGGGASDEQQAGERSVLAQPETPKKNRSLNREKKDNSEQKEKEDELCCSSVPLCEQSPKESIQEGREASITEPQADVLSKEELSQAGQRDTKTKSQSFFQSGANNDAMCGETRAKKKKNGKEDNESAEEDDSQSQEEPEVQHAAPSMNEEITEAEETPHLLQIITEPELNDKHMMEESDIPDSQQKKKKRKNKPSKSPAEGVRQEVQEHFKSDVRIVEDSVHLVSFNRGKEKKKKKEKEDNESAEEEKSQSQEELEVQHAAAYVNEEITEEEQTPRLSQTTESEFGEKHILEDSDIPNLQQKEKKKRKKNESPAENEKAEEEKKKTESNDNEEDVEQLKCNTAPESLHGDVEIQTKKITAAQCDVSVSESVAAGKPGVIAGGPGESAEITGSLEESNERVRKKKKRKISAAQESVEKDQEFDSEELKGTCEEATTDTGVTKKKKKHKRNEKGSESAADAGCSDEAAVVKNKWQKSMPEAPAAGSEEIESESLFEHALPSLDTLGNLARNDVGDDEKKGKSADNILPWGKAKCYERSIETSEKKAEEKDRKKATSRSHFELPSSHSVVKNKRKNLKRCLYNPNEDFLTDC